MHRSDGAFRVSIGSVCGGFSAHTTSLNQRIRRKMASIELRVVQGRRILHRCH